MQNCLSPEVLFLAQNARQPVWRLGFARAPRETYRHRSWTRGVGLLEIKNKAETQKGGKKGTGQEKMKKKKGNTKLERGV